VSKQEGLVRELVRFMKFIKEQQALREGLEKHN